MLGMFAAPQQNALSLRNLYFNTPMPTASQGSISTVHPTIGNRVETGLGNILKKIGMGNFQANQVAHKTFNALDNLTPLGAATSAQSAGQDFSQGNYAGAAVNGLGAILSALPDGGASLAHAAAPGVAKGLGALHAIIAPLYHGSPHAFDKFALDKIGTGEGAQSYGHGLYFAENPAVAQSYQQTLSGDSVRLPDGSVINPSAMPFATPHDQAQRAAAQLLAQHGTARAAKRATTSANIANAIDDLANRGATPVGNGHLYQVALDANPSDFANYDLMGPSAEQYARQNGMAGVRYLDQGSRTTGDGTSNYVVFDPSIIDILGRK